MYVILVIVEESWTAIATCATADDAFLLAPDNAQIEWWQGGQCVILRAGTP